MKSNSGIDRLLICRETDITCTGGVVFIGDGHTGKTHTALNLAQYKKGYFYNTECSNLSKSVNLEFDYFILYSNIEKYKVTISSQLFIMPGQKGHADAGEGLAFEDAVDMYMNVRSINDVIVLIMTYNIADLKTFQNLEYWLNRAIDHELISEHTSIILLGTHLDHSFITSTTDEMIESGKIFLKQNIEDKLGVDIGLERIHSVKISNLTRDGIDELQDTVLKAFFHSFELEDYVKGRVLLEQQETEPSSTIQNPETSQYSETIENVAMDFEEQEVELNNKEGFQWDQKNQL
jgi:GTPase SAR1 family protein